MRACSSLRGGITLPLSSSSILPKRFDTADLKEAKALLDELAWPAIAAQGWVITNQTGSGLAVYLPYAALFLNRSGTYVVDYFGVPYRIRTGVAAVTVG